MTRPRLGLWQRLMLLIGGTVALMWLALALTSVTFARFQTQFSGLAASQVPRIAATGELAGHSAQLAGLATRIIGGEGESDAQLAEVAKVAAELDKALQDPALRLPDGIGAGTGAAGGSVAGLQRDLARLPPLYQSVRGRYLPAQRVKMGMTGTDTAALGAAALPIFDEFNPQFQVLMKAVNTNALFGKAK